MMNESLESPSLGSGTGSFVAFMRGYGSKLQLRCNMVIGVKID